MQRIVILLLLLLSLNVMSQNKELSVGIQVGISWGSTITYTDRFHGIEGLLSFLRERDANDRNLSDI